MLYGSHYSLMEMPISAIALCLFLVTMGAMFLIRLVDQGLFYNVAVSAMLGDGVALYAVLLTAEVLKRGTPLPAFLQNPLYHSVALFIAMVAGGIWLKFDWNTHWADRYHHGVIVPLLVYLALTLIPVLWVNGTKSENRILLGVVVFYGSTIAFDIVTQRMDQLKHLLKHGINLSLWK